VANKSVCGTYNIINLTSTKFAVNAGC